MPVRRQAPRTPRARALAPAAATVAVGLLAGCAAAESAPATVPAGGAATASVSVPATAASAPSPLSSAGTTATAPGTSTATSPTVTGPVARVISVTISGGTITPRPGRVSVAAGTPVSLRVTSDVADEVHVHGYELEAALAPGREARLDLVADRTGLFEVETHDTHRTLLHLVVR